jgi:hypothetical protein
MLPFASYFLYAYVLLPVAIRGTTKLFQSKVWNQICPLIHCAPALIRCLQDDKCKAWLDDIQQCEDPTSEARRLSATKFSHVQHSHDVAFCRYQSFDRLESTTGIDFLECMGNSGCLEKSTYSDQCAHIDPESRRGLSFGPALSPFLRGRWKKLYTTGWDTWECQWTDFYRPKSKDIEPEPWMEAWPKEKNVWRMDLYWKNSRDSNVTFHMCNEIYPKQTWDFADSTNKPTAAATLKTRAVMWGTEAHENWYLLDANKDLETITIYYCAYTQAVDRFDSIAMILQKEGAKELTEEHRTAFVDKASQILGPEHGNFQRIQDCI